MSTQSSVLTGLRRARGAGNLAKYSLYNTDTIIMGTCCEEGAYTNPILRVEYKSPYYLRSPQPAHQPAEQFT